MQYNSNLVPPIIQNWISDMLNKSHNKQHRHNTYMMLEYVHRVLGKALDEYNVGNK
jgi:hypothetical protein